MNFPFTTLGVTALLLACDFSTPAAEKIPPIGKRVSLFDGRSLEGWEGDATIWSVHDGCLTGGSLTQTVKQNEFLATRRNYTNFIVRFQIRLTGSNGFINSGFQIRSQRVPNNSEMAGYQCDFGEPSWYGAIYDESRRNKVMASSDMNALRPVIKKDGWNEYVIRAEGSRVTTWINGVMGTDYFEPDMSIPNYDWGKLGIQVHGGGKAIVQVKDISMEELPVGRRFIGAPEVKQGVNHNENNRAAAQTAAKGEPVTPEEERARFSLPPGFEIELVAAEDIDAGIGKFVAVDWDLQGRLWTMTALEYPVDANETPEVAKALYASRAKDKVLVYDRDPKSPTGYVRQPRVFAEGLAIPLGILPYKNGAYVQHGPEIVFLSDTDGDGKADKREVILSGFGVQDSHLFPHQFTRAPGNWIWFAQGAFNYGKVKTTRGAEVQFDQTRMAKFRYDGSDFEITSQGPCNIWGLVLDGNGQAWIQEANDFGYPMMPFHEFANYPGCSGSTWKSYAPEFPGTATEFAMGGTGLSGLALADGELVTSESVTSNQSAKSRTARRNTDPLNTASLTTGHWPAPYAGQFYIANPITRKIQAIQVTPDGPRFRYQKLPDFVLSSDEMFRPVALRTGPDGCLYIVDWYNKIISHNEVPRNHPERDKKRGRIWRVKHKDVKPFDVPDFMKLSGDEMLAKLGGPPLLQSHMAWQAIADRQMKELAPKLKKMVGDKKAKAGNRIAALWAMEGLKTADAAIVTALFTDNDRDVRREAVRAAGELKLPPGDVFYGKEVSHDPDPEVRAEVIRAAGGFLAAVSTNAQSDVQRAYNAVRILINTSDLAPLAGPTAKSTHTGRVIKTGDAYVREFERYLVRMFLETRPEIVREFVRYDSQGPVGENRLLALLALEPRDSATALAREMATPRFARAPTDEELLRLAQFPEEPGVGEALKSILQKPETRTGALEALLRVRTKLDGATMVPLLTDGAKHLLAQSDPASVELGTKLAGAFQLAGAEPDLVKVLETNTAWIQHSANSGQTAALSTSGMGALQALREVKSGRVDLFAKLAQKGNAAVQQAAVGALATSRDFKGPEQLASLYSTLPAAAKKVALAGLSSTRHGATALVKALRNGSIGKDEIDGSTFDKLQTVLGEDKELAALMQEMASLFRPVLRLNGEDNAWSETDITLDGPFTVETWVKLDAGIDNNDGIFGAPGALDMNFFGGQFRVWVSGGVHDAIVAKKKTVADVWTHLAVTRDAKGLFRIYQNGELDADDSKPVPQKFEKVRIGWTAPAKGTAGWLSEFRIWNQARGADEIRADFDRSFDGGAKPVGLAHLFTGTTWGRLRSGAKVQKTQDFPTLLTAAEAQALATRFEYFRNLAAQDGNRTRGEGLFRTSCCQSCHSVGGRGGQIGPVLNGAGALGVEALLRNLLTPNSAMEPGYRVFRVELKDGEVLDGLLVSQSNEAIVLRRLNAEDVRIPQENVKRAAFTKTSMMPEGLLDVFQPKDVSDLFSYLKTLK